MAKEYIEREAVLKTPPFTKCVGDLSEYSEGYLDCVQDACEAVRKIPAADVEPVRHGYWNRKYKSGMIVNDGYVSSCCDMWNERQSDFCPYCGADMRGVVANE